MYEVIVLFDGYSKMVEDGMLANSSCTLLKSDNGEHIIVDTLTSSDGKKLKTELNRYSIECTDIKYVVCTHGHSDHIGCNYLFTNAKFIVGYDVSLKDLYYYHDFKGGKPYIINEYVKVIPSPGHTLEDVTVLVESKNKGIVAVAGDLFEKEEDLNDDTLWKSASRGSEEIQLTNRKMVLKLANWIIPGHGPMFKVPEVYKLEWKQGC